MQSVELPSSSTVRFLTQILPQSFQHAVDLHGWDSRPTAADKNHGVQTLKISTSFDMALHNKSFQGHQDPEPDLLFFIHHFVSCSVQGTVTSGADEAESCQTNLSSMLKNLYRFCCSPLPALGAIRPNTATFFARASPGKTYTASTVPAPADL